MNVTSQSDDASIQSDRTQDPHFGTRTIILAKFCVFLSTHHGNGAFNFTAADPRFICHTCRDGQIKRTSSYKLLYCTTLCTERVFGNFCMANQVCQRLNRLMHDLIMCNFRQPNVLFTEVIHLFVPSFAHSYERGTTFIQRLLVI